MRQNTATSNDPDRSTGIGGNSRSGQFFIIAAVLIAGMLFLISNTLITASDIDYGTVLRSHDIDTVENLATQTDTGWWNTDYHHRKAIILEEVDGRFLTNESVPLALDAPRNHLNETCSDIRVVHDGELMPWTNTTPCTIDTYPTDFSVVDNGAVLRLKMDEGAGQWANDSSGEGNNGQLGGSTADQTSDPDWSTGKFQDGLRFDGGDDYVEAPTLSTLDTGNVTVMGWARSEGSTGSRQTIVSAGEDTSTGTVLAIDNGDNQIHFWVHTSGGWTDVATATTYDAWIHIAGVYDGDTLSLYTDGELQNTVSLSGSMDTPTSDTGIGARNSDDNHWFNGNLDDVRVYRKALTADQIEGIAQNGVGLNASVTLPPEEKTDALYVYYDNLFPDEPPTDPAGIQHVTEESPNVTFIGPERRREEVLRQIDAHVEELDSELSFDVRFTIDSGCGTVALRTPISSFAKEVC